MFRLVAFSSFLVWPTFISNAQSYLDSLETKLRSGLHDTSRVDILLLMSSKSEDDSLSLQYMQEAIALSEEINDRMRMSKCYLQLARIHDYKGNLREARASINLAQNQLEYFHDKKIEADVYNYHGVLDYFEGTYSGAVANLWKALRLYEELGDSAKLAACYLNIGNCYKELHNKEKTLEYYLKSLSIYERSKNESGMAMAIGNVGNVYKDNHDYDSALYYYNKSLQMNLRNGHKEDARIDYNNMGNIFLEKGDYKIALPYFQESYRISKSINSERGMLVASFNIAAIELKTGNTAAAINAFQELLKTAKELNYKEDVKDVYEILSIAYEDTGQFDLALKYRKEYEIWKDSLINENHLNQVKEQEIKYETQKKDQEIQLLAKEKLIQEKETQRQSTIKKAFIAGFVLVCMSAVLAIYSFRQRLILMKTNNEIKEVNLKHQLSELEMKALRAQINPHFLFNCLNSINRMIVKGENESASLYLKKFSKLVRLIVENVETNRVSLDNELALIEAYIQLEELRFKGKIGYEISIDERIEKENTFLPPMVLQPFVENAIWHGLMYKDADEQGRIKIVVKEDDEALLCTIEDNGIGRARSEQLKEKNAAKTKSIGIKITEERLKLLNRERLQELVKIIDLKDTFDAATGTRVEISIPLS